jgi:hypothetical protein
MKLKEIDGLTDIEPLEKIKLKMDCERIRIERFRAWGTVLSIIIPLLVATITIIYGVWSENERAKTNFEIKAVEIVMNASSPQAATNKAIVIAELFPDSLPKNFKEKMLSLYGKSYIEDRQQ